MVTTDALARNSKLCQTVESEGTLTHVDAGQSFRQFNQSHWDNVQKARTLQGLRPDLNQRKGTYNGRSFLELGSNRTWTVTASHYFWYQGGYVWRFDMECNGQAPLTLFVRNYGSLAPQVNRDVDTFMKMFNIRVGHDSPVASPQR